MRGRSASTGAAPRADAKDVVLLTLGTGVGGGAHRRWQNRAWQQRDGGELGHVCVEPDGMPCDCGAHGCLEAYASASGLCGLLKQRLQLGRRRRFRANTWIAAASFPRAD